MKHSLKFALAVSLATLSMSSFASGSAEKSAQTCWSDAFKGGNADEIAACYAPDAVFWLPGGEMATGRAAIRDVYAGFLEGYSIKSITMSPLGESQVGDQAVHWGQFVVVAVSKADGSEMTERGRYTDVSKKIDGRWVYTVDHASDDPSAAPATGTAN